MHFQFTMNGFIRTVSDCRWRKTWKAESSPGNQAASSGSYANGAAVVTGVDPGTVAILATWDGGYAAYNVTVTA